MKNQEILDDPNKEDKTIWFKKSKQMLLISGLMLIVAILFFGRSPNHSIQLILCEPYEIFGWFLCIVATIVGGAGVKYWFANLRKREQDQSSSVYILLLQIIILLPLLIVSITFIPIFTECLGYLFTVRQ